MKRHILSIAFVMLCLTSCNFLDQTPQDKVSPEDYFKTEQDLQLFTNPLYNNMLDKTPYEAQSDHYVHLNLSTLIRGGNARTVPASGGGWTWTNLRRMNTLLGNLDKCEDPAVATKYEALTKFFRAYFYFEKVKRFGDVPWIDKELESTDAEILYGKRDSREFVMTKMLEDIDFAIENLGSEVSTYRVNRWAALALKAQFCLYEGTFRKYHGLTLEGNDYQYYLDLAAKAAKEIIDNGPYRLASDYRMLFAQVDADANEYILAINNDYALQICNNTCAYALMPTQGCPGLTRKFVNSFLMKDGSRFTDKEGWETMGFKDQTKDRDPRLGYCTITPGYKRLGATRVSAPDLGSSVTGFQISKYVMDCTLPEVDRVGKSYNDMPVYRLAEVYLIYAEALAELGTITQNDLDISVNLLRDRVGMPHMNLLEANADPDPYLSSEKYGYRNVAKDGNEGIILEIRRERSIELAQENKRWDDLMRWKEGLCLNQELYGIYFSGPGEYDLTGDNIADILLYVKGNKPQKSNENVVEYQLGSDVILTEETKGYIAPHAEVGDVNRTGFNEERDYLYPVPINERTLNPELTQNPGWDDGLSY